MNKILTSKYLFQKNNFTFNKAKFFYFFSLITFRFKEKLRDESKR